MKKAFKAPSESIVETNHIVLPSHTNALGTLFGGVLMSWIDIAAAISAQRHSDHICVTASVDAIVFHSPIILGETVTIHAKVVYCGKTSMMVAVDVNSSLPGIKAKHRVSSYLSMVALDRRRKPTRIPGLKIQTKAERQDYELAKERRNFLLSRTST